MDLEIPLEKMTVAEKLRAIELIWEDLSKNPGDIPSPKWHQDILLAREQRIQNGSTSCVDWQTAKQKIRDSVK